MLITDIIDESWSVPLLNDFDCSYSTASIQRETLTPSWNTIWMDPFTNPHGAPDSQITTFYFFIT